MSGQGRLRIRCVNDNVVVLNRGAFGGHPSTPRISRAVKILMRLPDDNISAAHLSVPYNGLICQLDSLFAWQLEITVHCLCPDDFARHDNAPDTR
jgi:hypothetical protein